MCIAIECSYKLDQKNELKFLCELCTFSQIRSHILHAKSISLTIRQSKTDPFRRGQQIIITVTNTSTCLVCALHEYFSVMPVANQSGLLLNGGRFSPLSRSHVTSTIHQLLYNTNAIPMLYHLAIPVSFRIGTAITAAAAGIPTTLIKTLGHWKSNAYETYVQYPSSSLYAVSTILAHTIASTQSAWNPADYIV